MGKKASGGAGQNGTRRKGLRVLFAVSIPTQSIVRTIRSDPIRADGRLPVASSPAAVPRWAHHREAAMPVRVVHVHVVGKIWRIELDGHQPRTVHSAELALVFARGLAQEVE